MNNDIWQEVDTANVVSFLGCDCWRLHHWPSKCNEVWKYNVLFWLYIGMLGNATNN